MSTATRIVVCMLMCICVAGSNNRNKREQAFYIYPKDGPTELYLPKCDAYSNEACNVVQKRHFKLKIRVFRKCRCSNACSVTPHLDNHTLQLDSHSYIKFCTPVTTLETCKPRMAALEVYNHTIGNLTSISTRALCNCPIKHPYWRETYHTYNNYFNGTIVNVHKYRCTKRNESSTADAKTDAVKCIFRTINGSIKDNLNYTYIAPSISEFYWIINFIVLA